jgi:hypothetical protein
MRKELLDEMLEISKAEMAKYGGDDDYAHHYLVGWLSVFVSDEDAEHALEWRRKRDNVA